MIGRFTTRCAGAASGHTVAASPSKVMNSRVDRHPLVII